MQVPNEFFTLASFTTLAGLTGVTYVVTNTLRVAFNLSKPWIGLVVAVLATMAGQFMFSEVTFSTAIIGLLNACLVFLTASGSAQILSKPVDVITPQSLDFPDSKNSKNVSFWDAWF